MAGTLQEAFENAAYAAFEGKTNLNKVRPKPEDTVEVEGSDEQALLYNWLEALLVKFDVTGNLYSCFRIDGIKQTSKGWRLKAKI